MHILIVDDSKTILHVLSSLLKELGYNSIIEADNIKKAITLCQRNPPSLVISDLNMPGGSGLDLLRHFKGNPDTAGIPFIMLTTEKERSKILEATRAGLQSYLLKPIKKQVLTDKLHELSAVFGFRPPKIAPVTLPASPISPATADESSGPLRGIIKKEQINAVLEAYRKLWKSELTVSEFESFFKDEVFGDVPEEYSIHLDKLFTIIQDAGREGILNKLLQFV